MPFDHASLPLGTKAPERLSPFAAYDQAVHGAVAEMTGGRSPILAMEAWLDWITHLALSPGKQMDLYMQAATASMKLANSRPGPTGSPADMTTLPYDLLENAHRASRAWWKQATTGVRGVSGRHEQVLDAKVSEMFQALSPKNSLLTNPALQRATLEQGGANLLKGAKNFADDHVGPKHKRAPSDTFVVGKTLAITPGQGRVPQPADRTDPVRSRPRQTVRPEPVLIVPAWIMKYYILDLSPQQLADPLPGRAGPSPCSASPGATPMPTMRDLALRRLPQPRRDGGARCHQRPSAGSQDPCDRLLPWRHAAVHRGRGDGA